MKCKITIWIAALQIFSRQLLAGGLQLVAEGEPPAAGPLSFNVKERLPIYGWQLSTEAYALNLVCGRGTQFFEQSLFHAPCGLLPFLIEYFNPQI